MITEKQCTKCKLIKTLNLFYKSVEGKFGKQSMCIECTKIQVAYYRKVRLSKPGAMEAERKRGRDKYYKHTAGKKVDYAKKAAANARWEQRNPEKVAAHNAISHMTIKGVRLHHWSYQVQHHKDVIELTTKQHYKAHRFIVYDQPTCFYRRRDTNELLTTKAEHEAYINFCIANFQD